MTYPRIRIATPDDLEAIVAIYNQAVLAGFQTGDMTLARVEERRAWLDGHTPTRYPVYLCEIGNVIAGWLSVSPYRAGREALRFTAEVSYYVEQKFRCRGVASALLQHSIEHASTLGLKTYFAIVLDKNDASRRLLEKFGFAQWGHLPGIADFNGQECGQWYYGRRVGD